MTLSLFGGQAYLIAFYGNQPETCLTTETSWNAGKIKQFVSLISKIEMLMDWDLFLFVQSVFVYKIAKNYFGDEKRFVKFAIGDLSNMIMEICCLFVKYVGGDEDGNGGV